MAFSEKDLGHIGIYSDLCHIKTYRNCSKFLMKSLQHSYNFLYVFYVFPWASTIWKGLSEILFYRSCGEFETFLWNVTFNDKFLCKCGKRKCPKDHLFPCKKLDPRQNMRNQTQTIADLSRVSSCEEPDYWFDSLVSDLLPEYLRNKIALQLDTIFSF